MLTLRKTEVANRKLQLALFLYSARSFRRVFIIFNAHVYFHSQDHAIKKKLDLAIFTFYFIQMRVTVLNILRLYFVQEKLKYLMTGTVNIGNSDVEQTGSGKTKKISEVKTINMYK